MERAVRAATEPEPWLPPGFAAWVIARVLGLGLLVGAGWLVYDCGSSDRFQVRSVHVQGNVLLSRAEIDGVAAVSGANIFWVDRNQVAARLRALPLVQHVEIDATLPDTVDISILERQPVAFWLSGEQSYLVDGEGVILKAVDPETQSARACAGQPCDPRLAPLPSVVQVDGQPLAPGDRVDASALAASASLTSLLPTLGVQPIGFEWSRDAGLEVPTRDGWRVRFDDGSSIEEQLASLRAIRDQLAQTQTSASLIDLRFGDRPYFR